MSSAEAIPQHVRQIEVSVGAHSTSDLKRVNRLIEQGYRVQAAFPRIGPFVAHGEVKATRTVSTVYVLVWNVPGRMPPKS